MPQKKAAVQVRVDEKLKKRVECILERLGVDLPTAIRMFFRKVDLVGGIPFDVVDDSYYRFTPEEMKEIEKAYDESFDPKNLSKTYTSAEDMIRDLQLEE